jgi:S1-C subfamily serine protease
LLGSLAFLVLVAVIGQTLGVALGALLRRRIPEHGVLSVADRVAGAAAGLVAVLVIVWLLTPAFASSRGWPAEAAHGSLIVRTVDDVAPDPPETLRTLGRLVSEGPEVFERLTSPDAGPPPLGVLDAQVAQRVLSSVVKVEGRACDLIQQGSGFVLAPDVVVTNAHVVAGEDATTVLTADGRRRDAVIVGFDPTRDVAVLRVGDLGLAPLGEADGQVDTNAVVVGYPGGGSETQSPARIDQQIVAEGRDIYRTSPARREIFVLAAELEPGDSGGALVDLGGQALGLAFAVDPSDSSTAYALTRAEVHAAADSVLAAGAGDPVDTGPCLLE